MELILHDIGADDRKFGHLMTQGSGILTAEGSATTATGGRYTGDGLLHLIIGDQQTLMTGMTRLAPAFLARLARRWGRPAFAAKTV